MKAEGKLPDYLVACIGGGSNAIGLFYPFIHDEEVTLIGIEAAGEGVETEKHAATITKGTHGVLHGSMSYLLHTEEGQIQLLIQSVRAWIIRVSALNMPISMI